MHIPDGYLSPQTFIPLYGLMVPLWLTAARKVRMTLRSRNLPFLALGAGFSFVVMMFNIPLPGGSSGHAAGGALLAILLGPWGACVAISLALVIQALLFADGGITALAANAFTMAVIMPFVGSWSYRLVAGASPAASPRRVAAAFLAGYLALNAAALYTALLLGIQPLVASAPDGRPLYAPYSLAVAVPAMALGHLLLFGVVEGAITALVIRYLQRAEPALLALPGSGGDVSGGVLAGLRRGVGLLALLSPLGTVLPWLFAAGPAWGEWRPEQLVRRLGYLPAGMSRFAELWHAPLADYACAGLGNGGLLAATLAYLLSALLGIGAIALFVKIFGRFVTAREGK